MANNVHINKIARVIIWPRPESDKPPRILDLTKRPTRLDYRGVVHVIMGESGTGKSALLHLVDYCLGSPRTSLPMEDIFRYLVSWYGVELGDSDGRTFLIARRAPGNKVSDEYYFIPDSNSFLPKAIVDQNMSRERFLVEFGKLIGLDVDVEDLLSPNDDDDDDVTDSSNPAEGEGDLPDGERVSVHDFTPFLLAPSEYLGRPDGTFYTRHVTMAALRRAVPYAFISGDSHDIVQRSQLREKLRKAWAVFKKEYERQDMALRIPQNLLYDIQKRLQEIGLVPPYEDEDSDIGDVLDALVRMGDQLSSRDGVLRHAFRELEELQGEERRVRRRLATIVRRHSETRQVSELAQKRLGGGTSIDVTAVAFGWLHRHADGVSTCPLCGTIAFDVDAELTRMQAALAGYDSEVETVQHLALSANTELELLSNEIQSVQAELERLLSRRIVVERVADSTTEGELYQFGVSDIDQLKLQIAILAGFRSQLVKLRSIARRTLECEEQIKSLDRFLGDWSVDVELSLRERHVEEWLLEYAKDFRLNHTLDKVRFSLARLSLYFELDPVGDLRKRRVRLDKIGGGVNWMGYSVALHLTLHDLFVEMRSPVPSFLILEQFTRVESSKSEREADSTSAHIFTMLDNFVKMRDMQIIVLCGFGDDRFWRSESERGIVWVDEIWEERGFGLIPRQWMKDEGMIE